MVSITDFGVIEREPLQGKEESDKKGLEGIRDRFHIIIFWIYLDEKARMLFNDFF